MNDDIRSLVAVTTKVNPEELTQCSLVNHSNILKAPNASNSRMDYDEDGGFFWNTGNELQTTLCNIPQK